MRHTDVLVAVGVVVILGVMIVPLPTYVMDFLLTGNISVALLVLMMTIYIVAPLEFSVFPGLLLILTLARLSLNVASTRLILSQADAGRLISAFGDVVVSGNFVLGFIIFVIVIIIQFVVITKGAGRVAEVAARFTLDAMPGKQMAIDADLNAGLIDETTARKRREDIAREAEFYGSMDGASKFVRGDAIAGILITLIKHYRWACHRHFAARHEHRRRGPNLYPAHSWRRSRNADPSSDHLYLGRHHYYPGFFRPEYGS